MPIETVVALLCQRAADHPDKTAYFFDAADGRRAGRLTYGDLLRVARRSATALLEVARAGDRVLLALPQGLEFVTTFFGCLVAGLIAVPAYPARRARTEPRLTGVIRNCAPSAIVCLPADRPAMLTLLQPDDREAHVLCTPLTGDQVEVGERVTGDSIAFLQYTSGSTGDPKGVVVTHANILHNEAAIAEAFGQSFDDVLVSWLPLFHDMGLVGNLLQTLYAGSQCVLLPPDVVIHRPAAWLKTIASYRATTSGGPNFIYARCEQRVRDEDVDGLDLASWRVAYNGSERVQASTLRGFARRFERYGFRRSAFRPCYGLAESTLLVSASREWSPSDDVVSCGAPASDTDVRIVDPEACHPVSDGEIGEIWVASPGVARGYWNRDDAEPTFRASLSGSPLRYLRTGDLGCVRGGELFVTDRLKDLVIVRGRNVIPADAEDAARAAHPAWGVDAAAAFGVTDGATEALAVVLETPREGGDDWQRIAREIRAAIVERLDIEPAIITFVRRGVLPRTSSGKIARHLVKRWHEAGDLPTLYTWRVPAAVDIAAGSTKATALEIIQRALALEGAALDLAVPLCASGLDSMRAVEIAHALEAQLGRVVQPARLLGDALLGMLLEEIEGRDVDVKRPTSPSRRTSELSAGQRGLWLLHQHDPTSSHYHVAAAFRLTGRIERDQVVDGLRAIARRHEALRWMIRGPEGAVIAESIEPVLSWTEWPDCSDADLAESLRDEAGRPLAAGEDAPPWRVHAIRRSTDLVLLVVLHHAIADLWSVAVLASDLRAIADGVPVADELCPYSDFVADERAWVASAGESLEYWKRALADVPPRIALAIARETPEQGSRQSRTRVSLTAAETEQVRRLARTYACTPHVVMLSAWQAILARYSGQYRFLIGAIGSHRAHVHRRTIGYCVNPWIVRATVPPRDSFTALIERVAATMREDLIHARYPFALLVDSLNPARTAGEHPFFDIVFVSQEVPSEFASDDGSSVQYLDLDLGVGPYNLVCAFLDRGATFDLELRYRPGAYLDGAVEKLASHLGVLLRKGLADPDAIVADVLLDIEQPCWPARALPPSPASRTIHERFVEQAAIHPAAVAVRDRDRVATYGELESQSALLAARLIDAGVGPETLVCVHLDRSADLIASMLAVLRAGGAYVPIDSQAPAPRVRQVIDDSGAHVVVSRRSLAAACAAPGARIIAIDEPPAEISRPRRWPNVDADNLAYVIYTSGSTGVPKGCLVTHRNVCRLFDATERWFGFGPDDVWTMCHSPAFDFSVWEIWGALLTGGSVVVVPKETARNPEALYELAERAGVTVLSQTPSAFRHLAHAAKDAACRPARLRYVIFGGERLDPAVLEPWAAVHGWTSPRLVNMYGITETTVHVTYRPMSAGDAGRPDCSPIGEPIDDLGLYLLTHAGTVQLEGLPGVIHVGGAGVARGYHNRPDLTAERFIPDPFSPEPGGRMYDSGDLAAWTREEGVMFAGRQDRQVKIRGHRIELSEVETALRGLPAVKDAVAVARDPHGDGAKLFAYVTAVAGISIDGREIRRILLRQLPEYLVPSQIIEVPAFPLTANGKLDVEALPLRERAVDERPTPMTPAEQTLSGVWESVLGRSVGVEESFFDAGGDSLTAINIQSAAAKHGLYFTVPDLYRHATIRALAMQASTTTIAAPEAAPFTLVPACDRPHLPAAIEDAYPLCRLLAGHVFHSERRQDYETHVTSVHVTLPLDADALAEAMRYVAAWHPTLRTTIETSRYSVPLHLVHRSMAWTPSIADVSSLDATAQRRHLGQWIAAERRRRPDWSALPLARCHAHVTGTSSFELTLCEPFLDGWSVGVVLTDLLRTYSELLQHQPVSGRAAGCTAREHVLLERRAERDEGQREFWRQRLKALPECERPAERRGSAAIERAEWRMPVDLWKAVRTAAHAHGVSLRIALLAVHLKTMSTLTGAGDVVSGCLYNGRPERQHGERLVGIFVNALPFHVRFQSADTWTSIVRRVHDEDVGIQSVRRFPYAELHRMHGRRDLFSVVFNFTNFHIYRDLQRTAGVRLLHAYASEQMYFDLTCQFHVDHMSDELLIALDYQTARYDDSGVQQWLDVYAAVAASFASGATDARRLVASSDARTPTIRALGEQPPPAATDRLARLLDKVERMTDEDAAAAAATGGAA